MNKVEQISLQGTVFTFELDAKEKLSDYLNAAKSAIGDDDIASDVIADLEYSVAEHLRQAGFDKDRAVDANSIQTVLEMVGPVEASQDSTKQSSGTLANWFKEPFVPSEDKVIFGTCGAIAERLEIDAIWIRVLFVVLAFLTNFWFLLAYVAFGVLLDISKPKPQRHHAKTIQERLHNAASKDGWRGVLQNIDRGARQLLQGLVKAVSITGLISTLSAGTALILTMLGRSTDLLFIGTNRSGLAYVLVSSAVALSFWFFILLFQTAFFPSYKYSKSLVRTLLLITPLVIFASMFITSVVYLKPTIENWAESHPDNHFLTIQRDEKGNIRSSCFSLTASCDR